MVWLVFPSKRRELFAVGFVVLFAGNFGSSSNTELILDKYPLDRQTSSPNDLNVVLVQNAQAMRHLFNACLLTPDMKDHVCLELAGGVQVIGIKHE